MDLLKDPPDFDLTDPRWKIYSRTPVMPPHYIAPGAEVTNSMITEGCLIRGTVKNSVLFRDVTVEKDAFVSESIIMQGSRIGAGARLECVILDKNVTVTEGAVLIGTPKHPVIVKKGETV